MQYNQYFQLITGSVGVKKAVEKYMDTPVHQIHGENLFFYLTAYSLPNTKQLFFIASYQIMSYLQKKILGFSGFDQNMIIKKTLSSISTWSRRNFHTLNAIFTLLSLVVLLFKERFILCILIHHYFQRIKQKSS